MEILIFKQTQAGVSNGGMIMKYKSLIIILSFIF